MKNWDNIKGNKQTTPSMYYFHLDRLFNGVRDIFKNNKKTYVIKLEDLHRKNSFVMKSLCDKLNLNFEDNLKISSYQGKLWWGDQVSGRDINGINPNFNNKINEKLFFKKDIKCIEYFLSEYLKKYNYTITKNIINCEFLKYLPFKIELKCWLNAIITLNLKEILKVPYLWYKRVCYMNKKNFRSENFPEPLGNK
jgi:hypothetical protein